jgi:hypothetical protein
MRRLKNVFWNAKTERHEVAIAAGKYREVSITKQISPKANIAKQISRSKYREAIIAAGKYHEANIAECFKTLLSLFFHFSIFNFDFVV